MELEGVDQRPAPVPSAGVGDQAGRLVHDGEQVILVDDPDRDVLGLERAVAEVGEPDADLVPLADPVRRLGRLAVDQDGPGVDDLLDHAPGEVQIPSRQVRVDPLAHHPGLDDELGRGRWTTRGALSGKGL